MNNKEITVEVGCGDSVFATKEEAEAEKALLELQHYKDEQNRINNLKEYANKKWSWNVSYHRNRLKDAQRDIEYHSKKLGIALIKAKEYKITPSTNEVR